MADSFIVYLHDEGIARFCAEDYSDNFSAKNLKNNYMHLTNYTLNKDHPNFKLPDDSTDIFDINDCHKRTLTSIYI